MPLEAGARDVCGPAATSVRASVVITSDIIIVVVLVITATVTGIPAAGSAQLVLGLSVVVFIIVIVVMVAVIVIMMAMVAIIAVVSIAGSSAAASVRNPCISLHPPPLRRGRCRCIAASTRLREPTGASTNRICRARLRCAYPVACVLLRPVRGSAGAS